MRMMNLQGRTGLGNAVSRLLKTGLALVSGLAMCTSAALAQGDPAARKIDSWVIENTRAGAQTEFFVVMAKQANLAEAKQLKGKLAKGQFVYKTLYQTAQASQRAIRAELDARGAKQRVRALHAEDARERFARRRRGRPCGLRAVDPARHRRGFSRLPLFRRQPDRRRAVAAAAGAAQTAAAAARRSGSCLTCWSIPASKSAMRSANCRSSGFASRFSACSCC